MPTINNMSHKKDKLLIEKVIAFAKSTYPHNNVRAYINGFCEGLIVSGRIKTYVTNPNYNKNPGFSFGELQVWFNNGVIEKFN